MSRPIHASPSSAAGPADGIDHQALREAAEWRVRLDDPSDPGERAAFERWRAIHPEHERAWRSIAATWDAFTPVARAGTRRALEQTFDEERRERRRWLRHGTATLALLVALVPAGWLAGGLPPPAHLLADHHTAIGERRTIALPDGSRLVLNTATAVDIDFDEGRRLVRLHAGALHIDVEPDPSRPFLVRTIEGEARALGTRFMVERREEAARRVTRVTVEESRVELCNRVAQYDCLELEPDEQATASTGGLTPPEAVEAAAATAWMNGHLVADDRPLTAVLDTLARHHRGLMQVDTGGLADLRVAGVLPLDDIHRALDALAASQPIRVTRFTPWVIRVSRR